MENPIDSRVWEVINSADWENIGKALVAFAEYRAQNYSWRSANIQILPVGNAPEDIAQEVILKAISGERKYDPDKGELLPWLIDQVKSIVDALANSAGHRKERYIDDSEVERDDHPTQVPRADLVSAEQSPEQRIIDSEKASIIKTRLEELVTLAANDPELERLMEAMMDGCPPKPRFLAEHLGISIQEIYNQIKRLRRLARSKVRIKHA